MERSVCELCGGKSATEPGIASELFVKGSAFSFWIRKAVDDISGCDVAFCCTRDISDRACVSGPGWEMTNEMGGDVMFHSVLSMALTQRPRRRGD